MTKVLLADLFPDALTDALRALVPPGCVVERVASPSAEDFATAAADADILVCAFRRIDRAALEVAPKVRLVQQFGIGYDNLDVAAIAEAGVAAGYCPGFNSVSVAEHTVLLILAGLRRFVDGETATRQGRFPQMAFIQEHQGQVGELAGSTVGLVGLGSIGEAVAVRLAGFGPEVLYTARHRRDEATEARIGARYAPLDELLARSDIVSLHTPLNDETRHLIGAPELAAMKQGALLVNTSRGGLVDEAALRASIESGHLGGAALDVLADESANPFGDLPSVIVTPHLAGVSNRSLPRAVQMTVTNITRFLNGEPPVHPVPGT